MWVIECRSSDDEIGALGPVLRREDYALVGEAREILRRARLHAGQLDRDAKERSAALYGEARRQGLADAALAACNEIGRLHVDAMKTWHASRDRVAEMAANITATVLQEADRRWILAAALREAERVFGQVRLLTLSVSPADRATAIALLASMQKTAPTPLGVRVEEDVALPAGTCIAQVEAGAIRVDLSMLLSRVQKAVSDAFAALQPPSTDRPSGDVPEPTP